MNQWRKKTKVHFISFAGLLIVGMIFTQMGHANVGIKRVTFSINEKKITMPVPNVKAGAEKIIIITIHRKCLNFLFEKYNINVSEELVTDALDDYFTTAGLNNTSFNKIQKKLTKENKKKLPASLEKMKAFSRKGILFDLMQWKLFYKKTEEAQVNQSEISKYYKTHFTEKILDKKLKNEIIMTIKNDFFNSFWKKELQNCHIVLPDEYATINIFRPLQKPYLPESILKKLIKETSENYEK